MTNSLTKNDVEIELHKKIKILNNLAAYLESFLEKKEDFIISLKDKLSMHEEESAHTSIDVDKLTTGSNMLNEMISNIKFSSEKHGIDYSEGDSTFKVGTIKFVITSNQDPKLMSL